MSCREQMILKLATCVEDEEDNHTSKFPSRPASVINRSPLFQRLALQHVAIANVICRCFIDLKHLK